MTSYPATDNVFWHAQRDNGDTESGQQSDQGYHESYYTDLFSAASPPHFHDPMERTPPANESLDSSLSSFDAHNQQTFLFDESAVKHVFSSCPSPPVASTNRTDCQGIYGKEQKLAIDHPRHDHLQEQFQDWNPYPSPTNSNASHGEITSVSDFTYKSHSAISSGQLNQRPACTATSFYEASNTHTPLDITQYSPRPPFVQSISQMRTSRLGITSSGRIGEPGLAQVQKELCSSETISAYAWTPYHNRPRHIRIPTLPDLNSPSFQPQSQAHRLRRSSHQAGSKLPRTDKRQRGGPVTSLDPAERRLQEIYPASTSSHRDQQKYDQFSETGALSSSEKYLVELQQQRAQSGQRSSTEREHCRRQTKPIEPIEETTLKDEADWSVQYAETQRSSTYPGGIEWMTPIVHEADSARSGRPSSILIPDVEVDDALSSDQPGTDRDVHHAPSKRKREVEYSSSPPSSSSDQIAPKRKKTQPQDSVSPAQTAWEVWTETTFYRFSGKKPAPVAPPPFTVWVQYTGEEEDEDEERGESSTVHGSPST